MRTESTFSFGALALEPAAVEPEAGGLDGELILSSVPVISTLWPTCALSFESSASSRYVLPAEEADDGVVEAPPAVPVGFVAEVPDELPLDGDPDIVAFWRM